MRRLLLHLAVALFSFVVGLSAASAVGALFGTSHGPAGVAPALAKPRGGCPNASRLAPDVPDVPAPPAAPAPPKQTKRTRVVIRRPDGTVRIIKTEESAAKNF
jgi:hypothetical protein